MNDRKELLHTSFLSAYSSEYRARGHTSTLYSVQTKPRAVLVVPMNEKNEIYITKEFRPVINCSVYSVPGGFVEEGESYEEAAQRELLEETGLQATSLKTLNVIFPLSGLLIQKMAVVQALGPFVEHEHRQEPFEDIEGKWYSMLDLKKLLNEQEKWDSQALACLFISTNLSA